MPIDKQSKESTKKPVTPALSSRFRSTKAPLAPRLAGSTPASPSASVQKELREQTLSPPTTKVTKTQSFSNNITPRSGARNARISPESPASPVSGRRLSGNNSIQGLLSPPRNGATAPNAASFTQSQTRSTTKPISPILLATRRLSNSSSISKRDDENTKFFRANEAKTATTFQSPKPTVKAPSLTTSFLKTASPRALHSAPPSGIHSNQHDDTDHRFVRANDAPVRAVRSPAMVRKQSTTSMTSITSGKPSTPQFLRTNSTPQPRPPISSHASSGRVPGSVVNPVLQRTPSLSKTPPVLNSPSNTGERRRSFGTHVPSTPLPVQPAIHRKSASVSSFGPKSPILLAASRIHLSQDPDAVWTNPIVTIPIQQETLSIPSPDTLSPRSASLASSKTVATSVTSDTDLSDVSKTGPTQSFHPNDHNPSLGQMQSTQQTPLAQAQINAANARRERKVLDLEISNSSLLAINKTLEKELRKQTAELRRFRRLSRSGRLSLAPSNRSVSGLSALSLDTLPEQTEDGEDYSDEDEDSDVDDLEEDINASLQDPSGETVARARKRARDERRLMLDLSKHQELLIDSQKLTQSIRKCLNISEDLIKEGNQALKYKVGIGDVKLGGRVLNAEEFDAEDDTDGHENGQAPRRNGLLSPSLMQTEQQLADLWPINGYGSEHLLMSRLTNFEEVDLTTKSSAEMI